MSKKNKDIQIEEREVTVNYEGQKKKVSEFCLGKSKIGMIVNTDKGYDAVIEPDQLVMKAKTFENAVEILIREWNLHQ